MDQKRTELYSKNCMSLLLASVLHAASSLGRPGQERNSTCTASCRVIFVARQAARKLVFKPALAELDTARVQYMAVRTRSGRRSGATPLNGHAAAPYEWKVDALLTVVYLAVLYYWR